MIVEIVGPPGVGKSTIAAELDEVSHDPGLPLLSFSEYQSLDAEIGEIAIMKLPRLARWRALTPMTWRRRRLFFSLVMLNFLHGRPFLRRMRKAQRLMAHEIFTEQLNKLHPEKICIHHDGFTQGLWSLVIDSRKLRGKNIIRSIMHDYYERVQAKVILLEVDDALAAIRVFGRTSKGRFNKDTPPARKAEFGSWLGYHRELIRLLPSELEITRIDGSATPNELAEQVMDALANFTPPDPVAVEG